MWPESGFWAWRLSEPSSRLEGLKPLKGGSACQAQPETLARRRDCHLSPSGLRARGQADSVTAGPGILTGVSSHPQSPLCQELEGMDVTPL